MSISTVLGLGPVNRKRSGEESTSSKVRRRSATSGTKLSFGRVGNRSWELPTMTIDQQRAAPRLDIVGRGF